MNEEFVTEAIRNDRCIKANRLLSRFEKELERELRRMGEAMVDARSDLFEREVEVGSRFKLSWNDDTIVAFSRDNITMNRINEQTSEVLWLNISIRWVDPLDWGEEGVDGALCAVCYKINRGNRDDFLPVRDGTVNGDWAVEIGEDQYNNAPGIFYIPVETASDMRNAADTLTEHFSEFGGEWGISPDEAELTQ